MSSVKLRKKHNGIMAQIKLLTFYRLNNIGR